MGWLQLKAVRIDEKHFRIEAAFSNESPVEDWGGAQSSAGQRLHLGASAAALRGGRVCFAARSCGRS